MNKVVALLSVLILGGCTTVPIGPLTTCEPLPIIDPPMPAPVVLTAPTFYVVSEENRADFDIRIEKDSNGVFYAITPEGYTILAENIQELRRYIRELQQVVIYYKAYESDVRTSTPGNN